jgi:hypothetical protein
MAYFLAINLPRLNKNVINLPHLEKKCNFCWYFVCSCPGKAVTCGNTITSTYGHNHLSDPGAVEAKQVQNRVLQKACDNPKLKTAKLVEEFVNKCQDPGFRTRAVNVKALSRQIQKRKAQALHLPKAPQTFDDVAKIPEEFTVIHLENH